MSGRVCAVLIAPSLTDADFEASEVREGDCLFGVQMSAEIYATAAELQGIAYLLVCGEHDPIVETIQNAMPENWDELSQHHHYGENDPSSETWLPNDPIACFLLGVVN